MKKSKLSYEDHFALFLYNLSLLDRIFGEDSKLVWITGTHWYAAQSHFNDHIHRYFPICDN